MNKAREDSRKDEPQNKEHRKTKGKNRIERLPVGSDHVENWTGRHFKDLLGGGGQIDQTAGDIKQMQTKWGLGGGGELTQRKTKMIQKKKKCTQSTLLGSAVNTVIII